MMGFAKSLIPGKIALAAFTAAAGVAIVKFAKFESKMVDVGNLFGGTTKEINKLSQGVINISKRVPVAAQDLANSLFDVVSAGVAVGESLTFLETASKLAVAGVTDTKTAVDGLTSVMNAYSLEAEDAGAISDKFFAAQKAGKTTIAELSSSIGQVAPIANATGVSIDGLLGAMSALTLQGISTAQSATQIRAALNAVIKPTEEAKKV